MIRPAPTDGAPRPGRGDGMPNGHRVVGVALPVPEPWGTHLQRLRMGYGEGRAAHIPTHITLLPPTPVSAQGVPPLRDHLEQVALDHPAFQVILRGTGTFRPVSEVVFVQVARGVSQCERLETAVRSGPVERALDFPYHPHVTVAQDVAEQAMDRAFADLAAFTCYFRADRFRLYVHGGDEVWEPLQDFTLRG